jgi:hypothetical protein
MAFAYGSGPDNGYTDAPGESNCTACHDSHPLNSGSGSFSVSGPASFLPGQTYPITVTLLDSGQQRWGFELTTLGVGSCSVTDAVSTQVSTEFGNEYVKHTRTGSHSGVADGPVSWSFNWTAPVGPLASVTFYAAGNAADGNEEPSGDFIYSTSLNLPAALAAVADLQILANAAGAQLTWSPVLFATQYRVERSPSGYGPWTLLALTAGTSYQDGPASQACYRVLAQN